MYTPLSMAWYTIGAMTTERRKRPYSTKFRPRTGGGRNYLLKRVPSTLYEAAQAKARREHVSLRAAVLTLLTDWTAQS